MNFPKIIYIYDALCGWCYGFSPVIERIASEYKGKLATEVLSGGMMTGDRVGPASGMRSYIKEAHKRVEEYSGVKFGDAFLDGYLSNPLNQLNSEKPAIALSIFKEYFPDNAVNFAAAMQKALNFEGRDLNNDLTYVPLLAQYGINEEEFIQKLNSQEYKDMALYEFNLVKQLDVTGFPCVLIQISDTKLYLVSKGFTDYDTLKTRIENVLKEQQDTTA